MIDSDGPSQVPRKTGYTRAGKLIKADLLLYLDRPEIERPDVKFDDVLSGI